MEKVSHEIWSSLHYNRITLNQITVQISQFKGIIDSQPLQHTCALRLLAKCTYRNINKIHWNLIITLILESRGNQCIILYALSTYKQVRAKPQPCNYQICAINGRVIMRLQCIIIGFKLNCNFFTHFIAWKNLKYLRNQLLGTHIHYIWLFWFEYSVPTAFPTTLDVPHCPKSQEPMKLFFSFLNYFYECSAVPNFHGFNTLRVQSTPSLVFHENLWRV